MSTCCRHKPKTDSDDEANLEPEIELGKQLTEGAEEGYGTFSPDTEALLQKKSEDGQAPLEGHDNDVISLSSLDSGLGVETVSLGRSRDVNVDAYDVIPEDDVLAANESSHPDPDQNDDVQGDDITDAIDADNIKKAKRKPRAISIPSKEDVLSNLKSNDADVISASVEPTLLTKPREATETAGDETDAVDGNVGGMPDVMKKSNETSEKGETFKDGEKGLTEKPAQGENPLTMEELSSGGDPILEGNTSPLTSSDESPTSGSSKVPDFWTAGDVIAGKLRKSQSKGSEKVDQAQGVEAQPGQGPENSAADPESIPMPLPDL